MEVLVVEDDPRVARLVERALNEAGHRAETAPDGPDGLTRAQSGAFDVVVLDVMLPEMDGLTVCRTMRQQGVRTPVILLTARDAVPDRVRGLDAARTIIWSSPSHSKSCWRGSARSGDAPAMVTRRGRCRSAISRWT